MSVNDLAGPDAAPPQPQPPSAVSPDDLEMLLSQAADLATQDPPAATALITLIRATAERVPRPEVTAACDYLQARMTLEAGDAATSLSLIERACTTYTRLGMHESALRTGLGRMHALDDLGRHEEAVRVGGSALDDLDGLPDGESTQELRAAFHGNVGAALGYTGDHLAAIAAYAEAERIWSSLGAEHRAAAAKANQGIELRYLGDCRAAFQRLDEAAGTFEGLGDRFWLAKCLGHRAEVRNDLCMFTAALDDLSAAGQILSELGAKTELWRIGVETSLTLHLAGQPNEALTHATSVIAELRTTELRHDLADALFVQGCAAHEFGDAQTAAAALTEAMNLYAQVGDHHGQGRAAVQLFQCEPAADPALLVTITLLAETHPSPVTRCLALLTLSDHAPSSIVAEALLDRAERLADALHLPHLQVAVGQRCAAMLAGRGETAAAIERYEVVVALVVRIGSTLRDAAMHSAYRRSHRAAYTGLVTALLERGSERDVQRSLEVIDDLKGRTFDELAAHRLFLQSDSAMDDEGAVLQALYTQLLRSEGEPAPELLEQVDLLETSISRRRSLRPATGSTQAVPTQPARRSMTAVTYFVLGDEVMAFVVTPQTTRLLRDLCTRQRLVNLLARWDTFAGSHAVAVTSRLWMRQLPACIDVLQALYAAVLGPVEALLPTARGSAAVCVIPHDLVYRVPFAALHDGVNHLAARLQITLAPSLTVAARTMASAASDGPVVSVGVADERAPAMEAEALDVFSVHAGVSEDGAIRSRRPNLLLTGTQATRASVMAAMSGARLTHLACHGLFRAAHPSFSGLHLADGWLRAMDLAVLDLRGSTVVLGACESGRMEHQGGDEAVGLAASLLIAGARYVVVSSWMADDEVTRQLMNLFHLNLVNGLRPGEALRHAQVEIRRRHPHPFYWAPFLVVGAPESSEDQHADPR